MLEEKAESPTAQYTPPSHVCCGRSFQADRPMHKNSGACADMLPCQVSTYAKTPSKKRPSLSGPRLVLQAPEAPLALLPETQESMCQAAGDATALVMAASWQWALVHWCSVDSARKHQASSQRHTSVTGSGTLGKRCLQPDSRSLLLSLSIQSCL